MMPTSPPPDRPNGQPLARGGSLSQAPDGRLCTLLTSSRQAPTATTMQELWNRVSRQRYPTSWNGVAPGQGRVIYWTAPVTVQCGRCHRRVGTYRGYQAGADYGVVEDTARQYRSADRGPAGGHADPLVRLPRPNPPHRLDGMIAKSPRQTRIYFRCPRCRTGQPPEPREYERNLHRLGKQLFELETANYVLDDAPRGPGRH